MFEIGWQEIALIAVVALIVVKPKDLPRLLHMLGRLAGKVQNFTQRMQQAYNQVLYSEELDKLRQHSSLDEKPTTEPPPEDKKGE